MNKHSITISHAALLHITLYRQFSYELGEPKFRIFRVEAKLYAFVNGLITYILEKETTGR